MPGKSKTMRWDTRWAGAALALLFAGQVQAAQITIGLSAAPNSADPYFHQVTPNNMLARHVFDTLINTDNSQTPQPNLALSWTLEGDRTWVMQLRPGVRFHDGSPFTSNDVVYSLCRALHPSGPTGSFQDASRALAGIEVLGPLSLKLRMKRPDPVFLSALSALAMISAHSAGAGTVQFDPKTGCGNIPTPPSTAFDDLTMANGTGPYRLVAYSSGEQFTLEANHAYHGPAPKWDRVVMRALPNAGARLAGLLAGELDLIENPSAQDLPTIKSHGGLAWAVVPSSRTIYLQPDIARDPSPLARGPDGHNPLRDPRVREAISLAIDRKAITGRLMDGMGVPADRLTPIGLFAALPDAPPRPYDPARAKQLLAEAGATGMSLTLSATRDRYIDDAAVAQAIGQYLTRVGIQTKVDALPQVSFFPNRAHRQFSLAMGGWGYSSEGASYLLRIWLAEPDPAAALGGSNYGGYHSGAFNAPLHAALGEMDDAKRAVLLQQAERIALADNALIPLYWETNVWAFKDRYNYAGRADQVTDADDLSLKGP
jgi:peptide/nickel transport system substrate-binding protein